MYISAILASSPESLFSMGSKMWLTIVQHGGLGDVDGVVPVLDTESGRGLLEFGVRLPIIFFLLSSGLSLFMVL